MRQGDVPPTRPLRTINGLRNGVHHGTSKKKRRSEPHVSCLTAAGFLNVSTDATSQTPRPFSTCVEALSELKLSELSELSRTVLIVTPTYKYPEKVFGPSKLKTLPKHLLRRYDWSPISMSGCLLAVFRFCSVTFTASRMRGSKKILDPRKNAVNSLRSSCDLSATPKRSTNIVRSHRAAPWRAGRRRPRSTPSSTEVWTVRGALDGGDRATRRPGGLRATPRTHGERRGE